MMNKNKLWIFGDSFSCASGFDKLEEYYSGRREWHYPDGDPRDWVIQLRNHLNLQLERRAKGGASVTWIINELINNMKYIQQGDVVVVSDTVSNRIDTIVGGKLKTVSTESLNGQDPFLDGRVFNEDEKILYNYVYKFIEEKYESWELHYSQQIRNLGELLTNNKVNFVFWSHRLWKENSGNPNNGNYYQNITDETNGEFDDGHWGTEGHKKFFNHIKEQI